MDFPQPPTDNETRNIIDKLAQFVARNGPEFEIMTKSKQENNPKFAFLYGGEFFKYYQYKVAAEQALLKQQHQQSIFMSPQQQQQNSNINQQQLQANVAGLQQWLTTANVPSTSPASGNGSTVSCSSGVSNVNAANVQVAGVEHLVAQQNTLREQIRQSEQNLNAQHGALMRQQQNQIASLASQMETRRIEGDLERCEIEVSDIDKVLKPIIDSCTKDNISSGKSWILQNATTNAHASAISQYLLEKVIHPEANFSQKLHIIYLVNDVLHHCARKNAEDLKKCLENVVVPMYCNAHNMPNITEEQQAKLDKLLRLWEAKANYFDSTLIEKLKSPEKSFRDYQTGLLQQHAAQLSPYTQATRQTFQGYQQQHQSFVGHAMQQIQSLDAQILEVQQQHKREQQREQQLLQREQQHLQQQREHHHMQRDQSPMQRDLSHMNIEGLQMQRDQQHMLMDRLSVQRDGSHMQIDSSHMQRDQPFMQRDQQLRDQREQQLMQREQLLQREQQHLLQQREQQLQQNSSSGIQPLMQLKITNPNDPKPTANNIPPLQPPPLIPPACFSLPPPPLLQQQQGASLQGNTNNGGLPMGPAIIPPGIPGLPDLSKPPPGFPPVPPHLGPSMMGGGLDSLAEDLTPTIPYFDLPAGLMVPLIKLEDNEFKPLDPADIRLPPPVPPNERLLQAVEAFYMPYSHDRPRDSEGWEKLALYEYYKAKNSARKDKSTAVTNDSNDDQPNQNNEEGPPNTATTNNNVNERVRSGSISPIMREFSEDQGMPKRRYRSKSRSKSRSHSRSRSRSRSPSLSPTPRSNNSNNKYRNSRDNSSSSSSNRNRDRDRDRERTRQRYGSRHDPSPPRRDDREVTPPSFSMNMFAKSVTEQIDESNKGHQMLKRMGWGGTGLGTSGQGIEAPISGGQVRDRQDLYKGVGVNLNDPYENFRKNKGAAFITRMKARAEERS